MFSNAPSLGRARAPHGPNPKTPSEIE